MIKKTFVQMTILSLMVLGLVGWWATAQDTVTFTAPQASISIDGDVSDWADVPGLAVELAPAFGDSELRYQTELKVAYDDTNIYMLWAVEDDYDFNLDDHHFSAAIAVMFPIDEEAGVYMGATDVDNLEESSGAVDIWHWELDKVAGELSGGVDRTVDGNDPEGNFDDEFANTAFDRHDDGCCGDRDSPNKNNFLSGVWGHSNPEQGADGTWYFEMARPLLSGDPDDADFAIGETLRLLLAYWDADETEEGWTGRGHYQNSDQNWIEVILN
jgi:DMSO reductase family type II enzyme heme b subunit